MRFLRYLFSVFVFYIILFTFINKVDLLNYSNKEFLNNKVSYSTYENNFIDVTLQDFTFDLNNNILFSSNSLNVFSLFGFNLKVSILNSKISLLKDLNIKETSINWNVFNNKFNLNGIIDKNNTFYGEGTIDKFTIYFNFNEEFLSKYKKYLKTFKYDINKKRYYYEFSK